MPSKKSGLRPWNSPALDNFMVNYFRTVNKELSEYKRGARSDIGAAEQQAIMDLEPSQRFSPLVFHGQSSQISSTDDGASTTLENNTSSGSVLPVNTDSERVLPVNTDSQSVLPVNTDSASQATTEQANSKAVQVTTQCKDTASQTIDSAREDDELIARSVHLQAEVSAFVIPSECRCNHQKVIHKLKLKIKQLKARLGQERQSSQKRQRVKECGNGDGNDLMVYDHTVLDKVVSLDDSVACSPHRGFKRRREDKEPTFVELTAKTDLSSQASGQKADNSQIQKVDYSGDQEEAPQAKQQKFMPLSHADDYYPPIGLPSYADFTSCLPRPVNHTLTPWGTQSISTPKHSHPQRTSPIKPSDSALQSSASPLKQSDSMFQQSDSAYQSFFSQTPGYPSLNFLSRSPCGPKLYYSTANLFTDSQTQSYNLSGVRVPSAPQFYTKPTSIFSNPLNHYHSNYLPAEVQSEAPALLSDGREVPEGYLPPCAQLHAASYGADTQHTLTVWDTDSCDEEMADIFEASEAMAEISSADVKLSPGTPDGSPPPLSQPGATPPYPVLLSTPVSEEDTTPPAYNTRSHGSAF